MNTIKSYLLVGSVLKATAAFFHLVCIVLGAPWYRLMGAGEGMARLAEQGSNKPTIITLGIAAILLIWSLYALSGAGVIAKLPLLRTGLSVITAIYLIRGMLGFFMINNPLGRSPEFWIWSSAICLSFGIIHLIGLIKVWHKI